MKKSGLDELEALNLDWNPGNQLITFSHIVECKVPNLTTSQDLKYFDLDKKIQEEKDMNSPFTFKYDYGYLR